MDISLTAAVVSAIATTAAAIFTGIYVVYTYKILRSNERLILEQVRPYVIVKVRSYDSWTWFEIENNGNGAAVDVKVTTTPSLELLQITIEDYVKQGYKPLLQHTFIPPKTSFRTVLNYTEGIVNSEKEYPKKFNVSIQYKDTSGQCYTEKYIMDISSIIYENKVAETTVEQHISDIAKYMEQTSEHLKSISSKLNK